jgi:hypothetical protein
VVLAVDLTRARHAIRRDRGSDTVQRNNPQDLADERFDGLDFLITTVRVSSR